MLIETLKSDALPVSGRNIFDQSHSKKTAHTHLSCSKYLTNIGYNSIVQLLGPTIYVPRMVPSILSPTQLSTAVVYCAEHLQPIFTDCIMY